MHKGLYSTPLYLCLLIIGWWMLVYFRRFYCYLCFLLFNLSSWNCFLFYRISSNERPLSKERPLSNEPPPPHPPNEHPPPPWDSDSSMSPLRISIPSPLCWSPYPHTALRTQGHMRIGWPTWIRKVTKKKQNKKIILTTVFLRKSSWKSGYWNILHCKIKMTEKFLSFLQFCF